MINVSVSNYCILQGLFCDYLCRFLSPKTSFQGIKSFLSWSSNHGYISEIGINSHS